MTDPSMPFDPREDAEAVTAAGPPAEWLAAQPFAERAAALAAHAVGSVIGQGWLFPPVGAPGAMRWLFGTNDTDLATGELRVSTPLGVVSVTTAGDVHLDWRWSADPTTQGDVVAPPADRRPVSEEMAGLPPWHQMALDRELSALAPAVASTVAEGGEPSAADRRRLAELAGFVQPVEVLDKLAEIGAGYARPDAGASPQPRADAVPRSLVLVTPFESTVAMTEDEWRAAARAAGVDVTAVLGNGAAPSTDEDKVAQARGIADVLHALGGPEWLVHVDALAGPGRIDLTVAVTATPPMWTAVCRSDDATTVGGSTDAGAVIQLVRDALGADALGGEAPKHLALPGTAMDLFAALADLWTERGDDAFAADGAALAERVARPQLGSWSDAVGRVRPGRSPAVRPGAGNEAIRVGTSGLELHAQTRVFARRVGRPVALALVSIDDRMAPGGPATAGHVLVRTTAGLWVLTPHAAWPTSGGVADDAMISLAAVGGDDLTTILRTLLGDTT